MILKFRESHISNLESARKNVTTADSDTTEEETKVPVCTHTELEHSLLCIYVYCVSLSPSLHQKLLREEIQQLTYLVEHHPDRTRLMHENQSLKMEIQKLHSSTQVKSKNSQLARSHQYTLQLERQLRHYLARSSSSTSELRREGETRVAIESRDCIVNSYAIFTLIR